MHQWLNKLKWKIQNFMQGRYGFDELSMALYYGAVALLVINIFADSALINTLCWFFMLMSMFRTCSRNFAARRKELSLYYKYSAGPKAWISQHIIRFRERRNYSYFKCKCGTTLRVPKGRGKIKITCPNCKEQIIRNS